MNKKLLKSFLLLSTTLLLGIGGCTIDFMDDDPQVLTSSDETVGSKTRSLENAVFNEGAQTWMIPQKDPYTLENFQRAYDNLLTGNTAQPLTRSQIASIANTKEPLKATHYRLKIYPKNEDEQWKIEKMEDVKIAYIPFDYVQLTTEETEKIVASTRSQVEAYPEINPYTLTYDDLETCDGPADTVSFTLPILYAVWPCDIPLPDDLDYELECEVFIPPYDSSLTRGSSSTLSVEVLQILENEAISIALGTPLRPVTKATATSERLLTGWIKHWDALLKRDVPQSTLKQQFQLGSKIWETYTQQGTGFFSIRAAIPDEATYSHVFQTSAWKVTTESSTAPIVTTYGNVAKYWPYNTSEVKMSPKNSTLDYTINLAAGIYFLDSHELPVWEYKDRGIRIIASSKTQSDSGAVGEFFYGVNPTYIRIYCYKRNVTNQAIGTVLHELGHYVHYGERGGRVNFGMVHDLIVESYASYVGWYLTDLYYKKMGYISPSGPYIDFTYNAHQSWLKKNVGSRSHYSPFFVDLVDDFNEESFSELRPGVEYNPDPISNVPHRVLTEMAHDAYDWYSLRQILEIYINVYYSFDDFMTFKIPYEYWFRVN